LQLEKIRFFIKIPPVQINNNVALFMLILMVLIAPGRAQEISVGAIARTYDAMEYSQTIELSNRAIEKYDVYKTDELIRIYQIQALSYFHMGDTSASRGAFVSMLSLDPEINLDPVTISPKIINFYHRVRSDYQENKESEAIVETRYIQLEDPRPAAGWRSLVLPGWGQIYKDEQTKGYIILSGFALNTTALIISILNENKTKDIYLSATHPDEIMTTYDDYNIWHHRRQILTYSQILIWSYAVADAIWKPLNSTSISFSQDKISLNYVF
jgi:hypothetical protein